MKELRVKLDFYLTMKDGETETQAKDRFYEIIATMQNITKQESSFQVYEEEVQEV